MKTVCLVSAMLCLVSCGTFSLYRPSDCQLTAEEYGRCYADVGYSPAGFHALASFCAKHGTNLDEATFEKVRVDRLAQLCGGVTGVFTLALRSRAHLNGPEFCPTSLLQTEVSRKASTDGEEAGNAYRKAQIYEGNVAEAEKRRRAADSKSFSDGLEDRLLHSSAADEIKLRNAERSKFRQIVANYPTLTEPALTQRLKCTPEGLF